MLSFVQSMADAMLPWAESLPFERTVVWGDRGTGPPTMTGIPALALSHPRSLSFMAQVVVSL